MSDCEIDFDEIVDLLRAYLNSAPREDRMTPLAWRERLDEALADLRAELSPEGDLKARDPLAERAARDGF